ncbi:MAG: glycerophosphodiester phosphodiesterase family protein [Verrucomicrobiota bacterium]
MKQPLFFLCAGLTLFGGSLLAQNSAETSDSLKSAWTVRGHVLPEKFVIQSHRGAGELAPENTLEAFQLGWKLGTIPESDLRTTKDGVIVAFHDANFKRVVKGASAALQKKGVVDITFAELSKLDVGGWKGEQFQGRRVSKISDVFRLMTDRPERQLYLDIKNVDLMQLASEVRENKVGKQVILATTKYEIIQEWKRLVPESQTLHWMGGTEDELKSRLELLRAKNFEGITQLQLHVRLNTNSASAEPFTLSRKFIRSSGEEFRQHGIVFQSLPWDAAEPKVYWQLLDLGVMSFATDFPEITLKAVRDYYRGAPR